MILEVIAFNAEECKKAEQGGATQIELVNNLKEDGLTPSRKVIKSSVEAVDIPVHVMVRPSNTFVHSDEEINQIVETIEFCKEAGAAGVVFGSLNGDGTVNEEQLDRVMKAADGKIRVIFHRAIDFSKDYNETALTLNKFGIYCVLTSGGSNKAVEGIDKINSIKDEINYKILQGSGINKDNIAEIVKGTGINNIHVGTSARVDGTQDTQVSPLSVTEQLEVLKGAL